MKLLLFVSVLPALCLTAHAQTAPVFISQPSNVTVGDGGSFTINLQIGTSNFATVSWKANFGSRTLNASSTATSQINNLITASVLFGPVTVADSGAFQIVATNSYGSTLSVQRTLTVSPAAPTISTQPSSQTVLVGGAATLSVSAAGTLPFTYQWRKSGAPVSGATSATLIFSNVQLADAGSYTVAVTNTAGSATSDVATLTVSTILPPTITTQPVSLTVNAGANASFTVASIGTSPLSYQWRKDGTPIPGATNSALSLSSAQTIDAGGYFVVVSNSSGTATSETAILTVNPPPDPGRLVNLSILTVVTASDPQFTAGAVIGGPNTSGSKPLLIRVVGPSLATFGVADALADPKMDIFAGPRMVGTNDDWGGSTDLGTVFDRVGAFAFSSPRSKDAAIAEQALPSGSYTVQVSGVGGTTGTVLAELYDATPSGSFTATTPRLVNVSVLKQINAGDSLTAGFVIGGSTSKQVLIRAIGPTLASAFGVPGTMADPELTLFRSQTVIASNDNWGGSVQLASVHSNVGAFAVPGDSRDASLVVSLQPGNYTAQVRGVGRTGGVALVEVYDVPETSVPTAPVDMTGFALVPAGTFSMGDSNDAEAYAQPTHSVSLAAFYLAKTETTWSEWLAVRDWAVTHGYPDLAAAGAGKADSHPVQMVSWYEVVKWLNAKSEKDGLAPAYYIEDAQTTVYRTGTANVSNAHVKWTTGGYRLPTEAEWEYAARGGLTGKRFPWGDAITHVHANYYSSSAHSYDTSTTRGHHPTYATGAQPYTSPVGSFAGNGFGVQDTVGNVWEWCWDRNGGYSGTAVTSPQGPTSGGYRILRGGGWRDANAKFVRSAYRHDGTSGNHDNDVGFRIARSFAP